MLNQFMNSFPDFLMRLVGGYFARVRSHNLGGGAVSPTKPVKSQYKYRIISNSCKGRDFTNIDRCRIISSVILTKFSKIISIDILIIVTCFDGRFSVLK